MKKRLPNCSDSISMTSFLLVSIFIRTGNTVGGYGEPVPENDFSCCLSFFFVDVFRFVFRFSYFAEIFCFSAWILDVRRRFPGNGRLFRGTIRLHACFSGEFFSFYVFFHRCCYGENFPENTNNLQWILT